jgi:outer membrane protein assembly factor BamB
MILVDSSSAFVPPFSRRVQREGHDVTRATMLRWSALGIAVLLLPAASPVHGWLIVGPDNGQARSVAVDADGNAVVAGWAPETFPVMKIDPVLGMALWVNELPALPYISPVPYVAIFQDRDPVVTFSAFDPTPPQTWVPLRVVRLDAGSGAVVWQTAVAGLSSNGGSGLPMAITVDAADDVVLGGAAVLESPIASAFLIVKFDGADGTELWRYVLMDPDDSVGPYGVVALPSGDVLAAGFAQDALQVVKLAGADGAELWRYTTPALIDHPRDGVALVAGADGDAYVAMTTNRLFVLRIDGTAGTETWRYQTPQAFAEFPTITMGPDGDPIASGSNRLVKIAASDGSEIWNTFAGYGVPLVNPAGDVDHVGFFDPGNVTKFVGTSGAVAAAEQLKPFVGDLFLAETPTSAARVSNAVLSVGWTRWASPGKRAFAVFGFADRLSGARLVMKDTGDPSLRTLRLTAKDRGLMTPISDHSTAPTTAGATLQVTNPITAETTTIALPEANWTASPPNTVGGTAYKYLDRLQLAGPCKVVVLKGNRVLKAKCDGAQLAFTLDEATQGTLDVRVSLAGGFTRCVSFGGTVLRDEPGQFVAKNAGPPAACAGGL